MGLKRRMDAPGREGQGLGVAVPYVEGHIKHTPPLMLVPYQFNLTGRMLSYKRSPSKTLSSPSAVGKHGTSFGCQFNWLMHGKFPAFFSVSIGTGKILYRSGRKKTQYAYLS